MGKVFIQILVMLTIAFFPAVCWIINVVKLVKCDFDPVGKEEFIHLLGLIPYVSIITVWF